MDTNVTPEILRRKAAANGLILGLFTAACRLASESVARGGAGTGTAVLTGLLWLVQFIGCIRIMKSLMKNLVRQYPDAGNEDTAKYGRLLALASSIIFSNTQLPSSTNVLDAPSANTNTTTGAP